MPYADPAQQREYQRQWIAGRRAEWLAGKSCVICGSQEDLQVDHIDPAKKLSHRVWSWSIEKRDAELAKCQVLCRPHHQEKTLRDYSLDGVRHGTAGAWRNAGCRCDTCRAYQARTAREYRARKQLGVAER